ncbi:NAD(P)-binding protein [Karstenula rhodostoma CBS 690.94]|uniref:NAD(P)-binding protein n=1 Tax=Karstenula rhodostoma CBS 690.94 TaxID=1392251 RepID=A0A9P4UG22_9PLEO|nr:NAD(P)-binding protein [Karstenula rhodostoma CBS 690.94]
MAPAALAEHIRELRVLVTGGSGFLGAHIVARLLDEGAPNVAIVSRHPKPLDVDEHLGQRLSYHAADVADERQLQHVFTQFRPHAVIHTAAPHHNAAAATHTRATVEGTRVLLECANKCAETRAFVYTSSDSACVPTQTPLVEEKAELYTESRYPNPYALSKALADHATLLANSKELMTAVVRIPAIYGENDNNFIPQLLASVRKKEHKMQVGQNKKVFEFLYVKKAAEAHVLALRALLDPSASSDVAGEAFFVSDGHPEPFFDFARRCYAAAGSPVAPDDITIIPLAALQAAASAGEWAYRILTLGTKQPTLRRDNINHLDRGVCWSIEKAKHRLGYEPVADQDEAIKRSMDWAVSSL